VGAGGSRVTDPSAPRARVLFAGALLGVLGASQLSAQSGFGQKNLTFGTVTQGISVHISKTDGTNAARFRVTGLLTAQITFGLPSSLTGPSGATLPISFGSTDAGWNTSGNISSQTTFNPNTGTTVSIPLFGAATIWLGGTVTPSSTQRTGSYTGTITITATLL
jgi:Domain of unknown function (DUF4402)